jgi:hypothetical protein
MSMTDQLRYISDEEGQLSDKEQSELDDLLAQNELFLRVLRAFCMTSE